MNKNIRTIIVGGGQAGLATSYFLKQAEHDHLILEKSNKPAHVWRDERWDSFTLVTPNWSFKMPGAEYDGDNPNGFMSRDEVATRLEKYVERYDLPLRLDTRVNSIKSADKGGYLVETDNDVFHSENVVVATGLFQKPRIPEISGELSPAVRQMHTTQYRNPDDLPPGAVLVVGSGQSGCQIAEELYQSGRKVYLSLGSTPRAPRRYRGKDFFEWALLSGFLDRTPDDLTDPAMRFQSNPHVSGRDGGHSLNLHQFARDGVTLLGHLEEVHGQTMRFAGDLKEKLTIADQGEKEIIKLIDGFIEQSGMDAAPEEVSRPDDGFRLEEINRLDLQRAGISTIIWACGYSFDFSMVKLPVTDEFGYPKQERGVTDYPGLYFIGLPWLHKQKSGLFAGIGEDAQYLAEQIMS